MPLVTDVARDPCPSCHERLRSVSAGERPAPTSRRRLRRAARLDAFSRRFHRTKTGVELRIIETIFLPEDAVLIVG